MTPVLLEHCQTSNKSSINFREAYFFPTRNIMKYGLSRKVASH